MKSSPNCTSSQSRLRMIIWYPSHDYTTRRIIGHLGTGASGRRMMRLSYLSTGAATKKSGTSQPSRHGCILRKDDTFQLWCIRIRSGQNRETGGSKHINKCKRFPSVPVLSSVLSSVITHISFAPEHPTFIAFEHHIYPAHRPCSLEEPYIEIELLIRTRQAFDWCFLPPRGIPIC